MTKRQQQQANSFANRLHLRLVNPMFQREPQWIGQPVRQATPFEWHQVEYRR